MRISDWSSDVCSSDLRRGKRLSRALHREGGDPVPALLHRLHRQPPRRRVATTLGVRPRPGQRRGARGHGPERARSEEHTSELQSLMRISYAVFCLKKKIKTHRLTRSTPDTPQRTPND